MHMRRLSARPIVITWLSRACLRYVALRLDIITFEAISDRKSTLTNWVSLAHLTVEVRQEVQVMRDTGGQSCSLPDFVESAKFMEQ